MAYDLKVINLNEKLTEIIKQFTTSVKKDRSHNIGYEFQLSHNKCYDLLRFG